MMSGAMSRQEVHYHSSREISAGHAGIAPAAAILACFAADTAHAASREPVPRSNVCGPNAVQSTIEFNVTMPKMMVET